MQGIFLTEHEKGNKSLPSIAFSWLLILRWGAMAGQILLFLVVYLIFHIMVPVLIVSGILLFQAASNLFFLWLNRRQPVSEWLFALVMFMDVGLLTVLIYNTGGAMNPFTFLYLVHIVLGSILMRPRWAWGLMIFTVLCYASFFLPGGGLFAGLLSGDDGADALLVSESQICHDTLMAFPAGDNISMHLHGMWAAFAITAFFIVLFVGRIQRALSQHEQILTNLEEEKNRSEKLASLANLAAGAAHEFSTPLATIAVAAGEMLHYMKNNQGEPELIEDARLIRGQVESCKEILFQMAADAGEHLGEPLAKICIKDLVEGVLAGQNASSLGEVVWKNEVGAFAVFMPARTLGRTVKGLLKNARDASLDTSPVTITCKKDEGFVYFEVEDQGTGMDRQSVSRACEPFFTSKKPGKGLGLGLYLAQTVAERFGGDIHFDSEPGRGTRVILSLALDQVAA